MKLKGPDCGDPCGVPAGRCGGFPAGRGTRLALSVNLGFDDPSISALTRSLTFSSDIWQSSPKWTDRVKGFGPKMRRKSKVSETVQKQEEKWRWAQGFQDRWQL